MASSARRWRDLETHDELAALLPYVCHGSPPQILSRKSTLEIWRRVAIEGRRPRAAWDPESNTIAAFLFAGGNVDKAPAVAAVTTPHVAPTHVDMHFLDRLIRVFNEDVQTAARLQADNELWLSVRQTQFRRAIAKFSAFSTMPMLRWLQQLESSTSLRYEGEPFAVSIIMTKQLRTVTEPLDKAFIRLAQRIPFQTALLGEKWIRAATNTSRIGLIGVGHTGDIVGVFVIPTEVGEHDVTTRVSPHVSLRGVQQLVRPGTSAFITSPAGDVRVIAPNGALFLSSQGRWRYLNFESIITALSTHIGEPLAVALLRSAVDLSFERKGALFCVVERPEAVETMVPDHRRKRSNVPLRSSVRGLSILSWNERQVIVSAGTIDGAVILDSHGVVLDAACMIADPPMELVKARSHDELHRGSGARETAAWNASMNGVAIKVSEDGPISAYRHGRLIAVVG